MMFQLLHPLPKRYYVACSGGVDSMSVLHFLTHRNSSRLAGVVHINHGTGAFADESEALVRSYCEKHNLKLLVYRITDKPPQGRSKEDWWREKRYEFFASVPGEEPIILAHQLNDCVEEYLMCVLIRGYQATIPYRHGRCIRPFRTWNKTNIIDYANRNDVPYVDDPSNRDLKYKRNHIRNVILPEIEMLNPGIYNIVWDLMFQEDEEEENDECL